MQNRYAGDAGDFGKFGLLRKLENTGLTVGINWYLVADEDHNQDGKHTGYQKNKHFQGCDNALLQALTTMLEQGTRTVRAIENLHLLKSDAYYNEVLTPPSKSDPDFRTKWLARSFDHLSGCDLVFLDPDNGMRPKSIGPRSDKSIKYATAEEILVYYHKGYSVCFYSHRTREQLNVYLHRFDSLFSDAAQLGATVKSVSFKRGTTRDYFFLLQEEHVGKVEQCLNEMLEGNWGRHFVGIEIESKEKDSSQEMLVEAVTTVPVTRTRRKKAEKTTTTGYINKNNQRNNGRTDQLGTGQGQWFYDMECLYCGHRYYANGHDIWLRKCPKCQGAREINGKTV